MGYYLECKENHGKALQILKSEPSARLVTLSQARIDFELGKGIVCVVDNIIFEAAGFAFNIDELNCFADNHDERPKEWISMDRDRAEILSGFRR